MNGLLIVVLTTTLILAMPLKQTDFTDELLHRTQNPNDKTKRKRTVVHSYIKSKANNYQKWLKGSPLTEKDHCTILQARVDHDLWKSFFSFRSLGLDVILWNKYYFIRISMIAYLTLKNGNCKRIRHQSHSRLTFWRKLTGIRWQRMKVLAT